MLGITYLVILIWVTSYLSPLHYLSHSQGSVVVFGSWPDWTSEDVTSLDYCKDLPMNFAFGILVTAWVSILSFIPMRGGDRPIYRAKIVLDIRCKF